MFTSFFKEATAEKRKRLKEKELERASRADEELAAEEKKKKEEARKKEEEEEEERKPKKKRAKKSEEEETSDKNNKTATTKTDDDEKGEGEGEGEEEKPKRKKKAKVKKISSEDVAEVWKRLVSGEILSDEDEDEVRGRNKEDEDVAPAFSQEECKVFVGGISDSEDKIRARFSKWGEVKSVTIVKPKKAGGKSTAAFVEFSNPDEARLAEKEANGLFLHGSKLRVNRVVRAKVQQSLKTTDGHRPRVLYIKNLAFNVTEADLRSVFGRCGTIEQIELPKHRDSKRPKGIALIQYAEPEGLEKALEKDRLAIKGRVILCSASEHETISAFKKAQGNPDSQSSTQ